MSRTTASAKATPAPTGPTATAGPTCAGRWAGPLRLPVLFTVAGSALMGAATGGTVPGDEAASRNPRPYAGRAGAWAELLRLPALFTVPGDALAGAAAAGARPGPRTLLAIGSSVCLYEAGMALNDWADRAEDAVERPHRPLPSGRIRPAAALTAAGALTGAGLALAAGAGRPALAVAASLAATVWAYDLALKHTPAGPAAMAAARGLDLLLGAAATGGGTRAALPSAALLGSHTLAVTAVSRRETTGGSALAPLAALATTGALTRLVTHRRTRLPAGRRAAAAPGLPGSGPAEGTPRATGVLVPRQATFAPSRRPARTLAAPAEDPSTSSTRASGRHAESTHRPPFLHGQTLPATALATALGAAYAVTAARPYFHATLNPSPPLTQRAVGGGIRATIPLQAALAARSGATATSLLVAALAPAGRMFARRTGMRKVSIT
ncbi:SCO3242 family prenyltransferase [Streptomyces sp. NPDC017202]|uniref:SCO3242 family prenyltransferase n=1 Tax=Streptomyces sp. NPDC017202 TaxID=3364981 RepID=UPI0037B9FC8D